ncbi:MAG: glycosyltransferase family 4 protein [Candidatus Aenigmatarchaeota archaeon]
MKAAKSKKMRKLLIFSPFYPPHIGGLETHVQEFATHLTKRDYEVTVFAPNLPESKEFEQIRSNFRIIRYPAFQITKSSQNAIPKVWRLRFWRLLSLAGDNRPDYVMSRTRFFFSSLLALIYAKAKRKKYIHVEHGSAFVDMRNPLITRLSWIYDKTFSRLVFWGADKVVPISTPVRKFIQKEFLDRDMEIIYRGVEFKALDNAKPDKAFLRKHKGFTKICVLGRITKNKGMNVAIEAFRNLPEIYRKKARLFVIGDGPDREMLEKMAEGEKNIVFLGRVERAKAWSLLHGMDIFLNPAISCGGLSTSLLEAMYYGLPVISTENEGGVDVVIPGKTGILLNDTAPETIGKAIVELLEDKAKGKRLGRGAAEFIKKNFNWERVVDRYERLFEGLDKHRGKK